MRTLLEQGPGGMIGGAHTHIVLMGWMSLALMTVFYYIVPIISSKPIVWPKLIDWIFWIFVVCSAAGSALMIVGGAVGGNARVELGLKLGLWTVAVRFIPKQTLADRMLEALNR